jgi:hypothetical protein
VHFAFCVEMWQISVVGFGGFVFDGFVAGGFGFVCS